jgi:hypothetical protein
MCGNSDFGLELEPVRERQRLRIDIPERPGKNCLAVLRQGNS